MSSAHQNGVNVMQDGHENRALSSADTRISRKSFCSVHVLKVTIGLALT